MPGCVHAVSALDSSGDTAKEVAESKKWLAIAALIPKQPPPHGPAPNLPCSDHNPQPPLQTCTPLSGPFPVRHPQLAPALEARPTPSLPRSKELASDSSASPSGVLNSGNTASDRVASPSGIPSSKDMPPEQLLVCSRATGSTSQSTSSAPAIQGHAPSCFTGVGQDPAVSKLLPKIDCDPQQAQPLPDERLAEGQERVSDQQSSSCSRLTSSDAGASNICEQARQPCPTKAEGKA